MWLTHWITLQCSRWDVSFFPFFSKLYFILIYWREIARAEDRINFLKFNKTMNCVGLPRVSGSGECSGYGWDVLFIHMKLSKINKRYSKIFKLKKKNLKKRKNGLWGTRLTSGLHTRACTHTHTPPLPHTHTSKHIHSVLSVILNQGSTNFLG